MKFIAGWILAVLSVIAMMNFAYAQSGQDSFYPFSEFRQILDQSLIDHGMKPEQESFNFVVLVNTVRTQGPRAQWMRNIYHGLLKEYLAEEGSNSDLVSFVPFQIDVRKDYAAWNRRFSNIEAEELYKLSPNTPETISGFIGGHDAEKALLMAIEKAKPINSSVFIMISDAEVSHTPDQPKDYQLTVSSPIFSQTLKNAGIEEVKRGRIDGESPDTQSRMAPVTIFYRIYLPDGLTPLAVRTKPRPSGSSLSDLPGSISVTVKPEEALSSATITAIPKDKTSGKSKKLIIGKETVLQQGIYQIKATADGFGDWQSGITIESGDRRVLTIILDKPVPWAGVLIAVLLAAGIAGYVLWLMKPRSVLIGSRQDTVRYGRPRRIGGEGIGTDAIVLPEITNGQKIGVIEVTPTGSIIIKGEGFYTPSTPRENGCVILGPTIKVISFKENKSGQVVYRINAKILR